MAALAVIASLASAPGGAAAKRPDSASNVIPGRYVVVYEDSVDSVGARTEELERRVGFKSIFRYRHALKGFAARLTRGQARALQDDARVAYVAPDRRVRASGQVPLRPGDSAPTGTRRIAAATDSSAEHASGISVAVLDSGVNLTHGDLRNVSHGTDCVTPGTSAEDDNGHGTHVAGSIAATHDGSGGVVGVAPGTKIWAVKVLDSQGDGTVAGVVCGLDWVTANATAKNIKVLNMSLGGVGPPLQSCALSTDPMHRAVCTATAADVLNVVAAGNSGWDFDYALAPDVPAAYPQALTVTAMSDADGRSGAAGGPPACAAGTEKDDFEASFSNFAATSQGMAHTIAAPGVCITSTWMFGGYNTISGTSMASPHMAGVAALCENHAGAAGSCAGKTPTQVISTLRGEAQAYTAANPSYGFTHDPVHTPLTGRYYGYLTRVIDHTPPDTRIDSGPPATTSDNTPTFAFSSSEARATFECKLDDGAFGACTSPHTTGGLTDGPHTLRVRARDIADNVDPTPAQRTFTVDTTPASPTPPQAISADTAEGIPPTPTVTEDSPPGSSSPTCAGKEATIVGTAGNDVLTATAGPDVVMAFGGNDAIRGLGGRDLICAGDGRDRVNGGRSADRIFGQRGRDGLKGGSGNDRIRGGSGSDRLRGQGGRDRLYGQSGNDRLSGGPAGDRLFGGGGRDRLLGGSGLDLLRGGPGRDRGRQ